MGVAGAVRAHDPPQRGESVAHARGVTANIALLQHLLPEVVPRVLQADEEERSGHYTLELTNTAQTCSTSSARPPAAQLPGTLHAPKQSDDCESATRHPSADMWGVLFQGVTGAVAWLGHPTTALHAHSSVVQRASTSAVQPAVDNAAARAFTDLCWWTTLRSQDVQPCLLGKDVVIRESAGKGRGVFAARALKAGTFLTRYTGDLRTAADHQAICEAGPVSAYACDLGTSWVIDASDSSHSDWAHILNHSRRKQNCDFFLSGLPESAARAADLLLPLDLPTDPYALWYETTRDVAAGEELCTDYGTNY